MTRGFRADDHGASTMRTDHGASTMRTDDRGASNTIHYVLSLAMATILFVGLLLAAGNLVEGQRTHAAADELSIVGNRIATDLVAVDDLARGGAGTSVTAASLSPDLPDTVSGESYVVRISASGSDPTEVTITLTIPAEDITTTVTTTTQLPVADSTVNGGDVVVRYDPASGELVVANE